MAGIEEVTAKLAEVSLVIDSIDNKTDEVKAFIETLKQSAVTPEQLEELSALVDGIKEQSQSVLGEVDALDEVVVVEPPVEPVE